MVRLQSGGIKTLSIWAGLAEAKHGNLTSTYLGVSEVPGSCNPAGAYH